MLTRLLYGYILYNPKRFWLQTLHTLLCNDRQPWQPLTTDTPCIKWEAGRNCRAHTGQKSPDTASRVAELRI